jgi:hypothetical protein
VGTGTDLPMRPEIAIRPQQPSRHVHDDFFALLRADRLGAHLWVFVMLVTEHHHRDQASAVPLGIREFVRKTAYVWNGWNGLFESFKEKRKSGGAPSKIGRSERVHQSVFTHENTLWDFESNDQDALDLGLDLPDSPATLSCRV